jgi:hypothetical protein
MIAPPAATQAQFVRQSTPKNSLPAVPVGFGGVATSVQVWPSQVSAWVSVYPGPAPPTAVHDVALKQLIALSEPPPEGDGTVALVHADPFQVLTTLVPLEEPTVAQKLGPAHDTE